MAETPGSGRGVRVAVTLTQLSHRVPGGTATSVLRLAAALDELAAVRTVGVLARGDLRRPASVLRPALDVDPWRPPPGSVVTSLPLPLLYDVWRHTGRPHVERATGPVDLVHVTVPMRVGVHATTPVVATVHDLFPLTRPQESTPRGARLMAAGLEWIRGTARAVMVPSRAVATACEAHGFAPDRLHVVPWGVEVPDAAGRTQDRVDDVLRRHGLEHPYVLFVGTVEPRKNLAGLIRAMARLDRPGLTLALAGPAGWGGQLDGELAALASPVVRLGVVPDDDLGALYAGATVVCLPSHDEGFGLPVLEAMASGAAVVTSEVGATAEVAGDAAVLVDPADVASISQGLRTVLDDAACAARLRAAGLERAATSTWRRCAEQTLAVYGEVLGRELVAR
jgi:glycosyltransferase involved in cell wall biosynthesis